MMPEQLKQVTPRNRRTTPTLSDFMSFDQSFFEGLAELDSKGVRRAYERIHISSRYHRDRQPSRRRVKGGPDWDSTYFSELILSVWHCR